MMDTDSAIYFIWIITLCRSGIIAGHETKAFRLLSCSGGVRKKLKLHELQSRHGGALHHHAIQADDTRVVIPFGIGVASMAPLAGYYPEPGCRPLVSCLGFHGHLLESLTALRKCIGCAKSRLNAEFL
jgi:hypothetical protein